VVPYAELDQATARVAGLLHELGVKPGDAVGVMLPNVPYFAFADHGILRPGGVVVPMNVRLKQREVASHLGDSQAKLVFVWHEFAEPAQRGAHEAGADCVIVAPGEFERLLGRAEPATEVVDRAGDDTAVILYTSGTTGRPKGYRRD
jgi:long-chain acyl-CoA synthetase